MAIIEPGKGKLLSQVKGNSKNICGFFNANYSSGVPKRKPSQATAGAH